MALVFIGIAFTIERDRRAPTRINMNLLEPKGDTVDARFLGGPLHGQNQTILNRKYHRVALAPSYAVGEGLVVGVTHVYVRTCKSRASGAWLYIYWGKA